MYSKAVREAWRNWSCFSDKGSLVRDVYADENLCRNVLIPWLFSDSEISLQITFAFIVLEGGPMEIDAVRPLLLGARMDCGSKGEHGTIL